MGESLIERRERENYEKKKADFRVKQQQPYEFKVRYAAHRIREFESECAKHGWNTYVSVGGLDSITLLTLIRYMGLNPPAVSASSLEDKSIQIVHKELGVISVKPLKSKVEVIKEYGYPVISKDVANKIYLLQHPTEKNKTIRHAIITGETGAYGGNRSNEESYMRLAQRWLNLFGGYENEAEGTHYGKPDFLVSDKCCYYLKEKPLDDWAKEHNAMPYTGLMASEGGRRKFVLIDYGCNYFGKERARSAPFAIFNRQDILQLALDLHVHVPEIYGEIVRDSDGKLRTTLAQRTGCSMCGFGIHLDGRPHKFDLLYESNPKEWEFWMYTMGWGHVLDYIGVGWLPQIKMDLDSLSKPTEQQRGGEEQ